MPKNISLKLGICPKLTFRCYGPFEKLASIGPIAYDMTFPSYIKVQVSPKVSLGGR